MPSERRRRFSRAARLRRRTEFQRVYSQGIRVAGRHMVLFVMPTEGDGRLGITASRKIGRAVTRSRAKRRLRELYRLHQPRTVTESLDVVVNARASCAGAPWSGLVRDFHDCLVKATEKMETGKR